MIVEHPRIYTSSSGTTTTALLVRDGDVVAVGDEARTLATPTDEVVRPDAACVFPALCDAHIHLWGLGLRRGSVSLAAARSTEDVYQMLRDYDLDEAPNGWVLGRDWDQHHWIDAPQLDLGILDSLFPAHPLVLRRIDGHALWVNSCALRAAQIGSDWDPGPNGHLGRGSDRRPTGLLVDDAMNPVLEALGEPTVAEDRHVFLQSCELLRGFGCSAAHVAWMPLDRMAMIEELHVANELPIRLHLLLDGRAQGLDAELERGARFDDWLNVAGVKFFADGALGSHGAHLRDGYADGSHGLILETREHLVDRCRSLAARGWQVAVHAIGDAAATTVLDAFAAMSAEDRQHTRPRMEHCQMLSDADVARFAELGVTAAIQAIHMYSDAAWAPDELTDVQLDELFRWRDLADAAPTLIGGSDYPIEDPNPWHGIATSSARLDRNGRPFRPGQALTRAEALRSYTEGPAWASFREQRSGRLERGFVADFITLDRDPFAATNVEIWEMQVSQTFIGGQTASGNRRAGDRGRSPRTHTP